MLVELRGLLSDSKCVLEAEPGKLDIKRCKPGILSISLQVGSLFKLAIMAYFVSISCRFNVIDDTNFKVQRHDDMIKTPVVRSAKYIRSTCSNAVNMRGI